MQGKFLLIVNRYPSFENISHKIFSIGSFPLKHVSSQVVLYVHFFVSLCIVTPYFLPCLCCFDIGAYDNDGNELLE